MKRVLFGAAAAALALAVLSPRRCAATGPVGSVGGIGIGAISSVPGGAGPANIFEPSNVMSPQRYRDLKVSGYVESPGRKLPSNFRILRLRVNGMIIPMLLGPEGTTPPRLIFGPNDTYARRLFRAILQKQITVIGDEFMRERIVRAARLKVHVEVEGYVFDSLSPYMILRSVTPTR
jgi:hypothetical protein